MRTPSRSVGYHPRAYRFSKNLAVTSKFLLLPYKISRYGDPGFMHPCYHLSIYVQSCDSKRAWGFRDLQAEKCREWLLISLCVGVAWNELFASRQLINDLFPVA